MISPNSAPLYDRTLAGPSHNRATLSEIGIVLDRASFASGYHRIRQENAMPEFTLRIDNMHCGGCVRRVGQALASVEGVSVDDVRVGAARLSTSQDSAPVDLAIAALAKAGYPARLEP
jgi:copper chaperone CopZ